jgi:hypothetical protein
MQRQKDMEKKAFSEYSILKFETDSLNADVRQTFSRISACAALTFFLVPSSVSRDLRMMS